MKAKHTALLVLMGTFAATPMAQGADGYICFSDYYYNTTLPPPPTGVYVNYYTEVSNSTLFQCSSGGPKYTFRQLSQSGWTINGIGQSVHSYAHNMDTGKSQTKQRWMITIQRQ